MWKRYQRYRALDAEARKLFWRAVILLPLVALSLRFRNFKKTKEALQENHPTSSPREGEKAREAVAVRKICRMVKAGARYGVIHPTCLEESLVLWYLLQKQGIPGHLRIGVRKLSEKFEAHAWVEYEGLALNQGQNVHQHYAAFDSGFSDLPGEKP